MEMMFAVASALVAVAVSWGMMTSKMETQKEEIRRLESELKNFVRIDTCTSSHKYGDKEIADIKETLREIKEMIRNLMDK